MDEELKHVVEAILFAAGRKLELSELAGLCKKPEEEVLAVLAEWKLLLDSSSSPTMLMQDGSAWKLTVREKYAGVVKKVVSTTELPKGQLETLAVVAYKAPVLQSKVVKIRTNKAYDHLAQLENSGFITREKSGRSKLIKLAPKFFEYFDIDPSRLKHKFGSAGDIEKAIESKELEIEQAEVAQRKETEERLETPQIVLESDKGPKKLETYPVVEPVDIIPTGVQLFMEKLGGLDVYDVPRESIPLEERLPEHKHHKKKHKKVATEEKPEAVEEKPVEPEIPAVEEKPEVPVEMPEAPVEKPKKAKKPVKEVPPVEVPVEKEVPLTSEQKLSQEVAEKTAQLKPKEFEGKGLFPKGIPPEVEAKIEERIKKILSGEPKEEE
ncbi:Segregation and condensation protein B [uncultured archaeon]|nr:Segregation and condensation protein B [uncultured archaeon]